MKFISGDVNGDSKLDPSETWSYTCSSNLTTTTTNTAIASGTANGMIVRDIAIATVVVAAFVPKLPNTGLATMNSLKTLLAIAGGVIALTAIFYAFYKKQNA
jgi:LPXTG-motif cell wall-anchored protein